MKYFRHKCAAHADIKIQQLSREHPYSGYAIFFYLLEIIGLEGVSGRLSYTKCLDYTSFFFADKPESIDRVITRAVSLGLFVKENDSLFCPKLVNGYSDEWSSRKRIQNMSDALAASGEIANPHRMAVLEKERAKHTDTVKQVLEHLNAMTGKQYRWQSKDNQLLVLARTKEGYTVEDLKKVIDNQCALWMGDEKMEMYLRPATLFLRSKVEGYLNNDKGLASKMKDWGRK